MSTAMSSQSGTDQTLRCPNLLVGVGLCRERSCRCLCKLLLHGLHRRHSSCRKLQRVQRHTCTHRQQAGDCFGVVWWNVLAVDQHQPQVCACTRSPCHCLEPLSELTALPGLAVASCMVLPAILTPNVVLRRQTSYMQPTTVGAAQFNHRTKHFSGASLSAHLVVSNCCSEGVPDKVVRVATVINEPAGNRTRQRQRVSVSAAARPALLGTHGAQVHVLRAAFVAAGPEQPPSCCSYSTAPWPNGRHQPDGSV